VHVLRVDRIADKQPREQLGKVTVHVETSMLAFDESVKRLRSARRGIESPVLDGFPMRHWRHGLQSR
jgi:hypothetical protein